MIDLSPYYNYILFFMAGAASMGALWLIYEVGVMVGKRSKVEKSSSSGFLAPEEQG
jgi:hypothetical protein